MTQKIYIWTSPLPLLAFWGISIYLGQFEGWGKSAGAVLFLGPILLSSVMVVIGVVLIVQARKKSEPVANLWLSTLMAGSLGLYIMAKGIVQELTKSFG